MVSGSPVSTTEADINAECASTFGHAIPPHLTQDEVWSLARTAVVTLDIQDFDGDLLVFPGAPGKCRKNNTYVPEDCSTTTHFFCYKNVQCPPGSFSTNDQKSCVFLEYDQAMSQTNEAYCNDLDALLPSLTNRGDGLRVYNQAEKFLVCLKIVFFSFAFVNCLF